MRFKASVWVRALDLQVLSVNTVEDACAILRRWPHDARAGLFVEVRDVLEKAAAGAVTPDDARRSFVSLLEQANMLAESNPA
ncbi:MAG: DUF982 domain-containing protein [Mesorhizobium sp.]